jgi:hypothetical protein
MNKRLGVLFAGAVLTLVVIRQFSGVSLSGDDASEAVSSGTREVRYELELRDPVQPDRPAQSYPVVLSLDEQGFPLEYRLRLITGVCLENLCKPLVLTLFWDDLGTYSRLEYAEQEPLTKNDHDPFTPADYRRLDSILKDKRSILGRYPLQYFLVPPAEEAEGVDAVTSATPQALQDAVVPGAAYTAWALWRWVNGEITDHLSAFTKAFLHRDYLLYCLRSDDPRRVEFALRHLLQPGTELSIGQEACLEILERAGRANCLLALEVLTKNVPDPDRLHRELIKRIGLNAGSSRLILGYFEKLGDAPPALWEQMADQLGRIDDYMDLHTAIHLIEARGGISGTLLRSAEKLRGHPNPDISQLAQRVIKSAQYVQGE